jgi:hypothetical protein
MVGCGALFSPALAQAVGAQVTTSTKLVALMRVRNDMTISSAAPAVRHGDAVTVEERGL